jgi:hypothetical protein
MDRIEFVDKLQCLIEELYGVILNITSFSSDDARYRRTYGGKREKRNNEGFLESIPWLSYTLNLASNFSVGVPEITEDQFFEDFSYINQIQAKKRGQINKEVFISKR